MAEKGTDFLYGDLIIRCNQCGNEQLVEEMVTDGRAIYIFNKYDSSLKLSCDKCKISMEMLIRESEVIDDELKEINELKNH